MFYNIVKLVSSPYEISHFSLKLNDNLIFVLTIYNISQNDNNIFKLTILIFDLMVKIVELKILLSNREIVKREETKNFSMVLLATSQTSTKSIST